MIVRSAVEGPIALLTEYSSGKPTCRSDGTPASPLISNRRSTPTCRRCYSENYEMSGGAFHEREPKGIGGSAPTVGGGICFVLALLAHGQRPTALGEIQNQALLPLVAATRGKDVDDGMIEIRGIAGIKPDA